MAHEFIARKGLIVPSGSLLVNTGSVNVGGTITASFFKGDGSNLTNLPATTIASSVVITNTFTGDGTTNTFNLGSQYIANSLMVSVDGLFYTPSTDFTISSNDIVFTSAPPSASDITVRAMVNIVSGGVGTYSGSFIGTASFATTALTASYVSGAASDWNTLNNKPAGIVSSSTQVDYLQLQNIPSDIVSSSTQVVALLPTGTVSSSAQINTGSFSGSFTGSVLGTSSLAQNAVTASYVEYTNIGNKPTLVSASSQIDVTQTTNIATIATTGSNTFTGIQTINNTTNSTSYLDGALVVAGGVGITKNVNISGSLTVTGLLTAVSMSTQYVTSSQYVVGTSRVILNDDDLVRFAGLSIVDSGSASPTTASILWDSLQHRFIYENLSGSGYNSAIIIAGPKNTGSLGDETELTVGRIPYATGGDHIDNSPARVEGTTVHFDANVYATGSITAAAFTGSVFGTTSTASYVEYNNVTNKPTLVSASSQISYGGLSNIPADIVSSSAQVIAFLPTGTVSSSVQINTGSFTGSFIGELTGSLLGTSSHAVAAVSSSYALTASFAMNGGGGGGSGFPFAGDAVITGSLYVTGSTISGSFVGDGSGITGVNVSTSVVSDIYQFVGNGSTQLFVLSQSYLGNNVQVSVDGLVFTQGVDYTYTTGSITFVVAPPSSSNVLVSALLNSQTNLSGSFSGSFIGDGHGITNLPLAITIDTYKFSGDGVTTAYNLNYEYGPNSLFIDVGGITYVHPEDYTISGTTITFTEVPASSSNILVRAFQSQSFLGSSSFSTTSSYVDYTNVGNKPTLVSASSQVSYLGLSNIPANIVSSSTQVTAFLPTGTVSSSVQINTGSFSGSFTGTLTGTSSLASNAVTASYALTASYAENAGAGAGFPFSGSAVITGSLLVSQSGVTVSGSVNVSGGITGSFSGSGAGLTDLRASIGIDTYTFVGNGSTTEYYLSQSYTSNSLLVSVEGINYAVTEDYALYGPTMSFTVAPPSQSNVVVKAFLAVSSGSYINYTGSFIGDGYGLNNLRGSLAIDEYIFIGNGSTTSYVLSSSYAPPSLNVTVGGLRYVSPNDYTVTGSTINFTQAPASQSLIVFDGFVVVSSGSVGTFSGSFLGNATTATSASYATTSSFASNVLKTKAGLLTNTSFGGTPYTASVTFSSAFNNINYSIAVTGEDARIFTVESKTASGFVVNTNSNTAVTGTTYWTCTAFGEN